MCADDLSASTRLPKQPVPKGHSSAPPCLFCLFNLLTMPPSLRRSAQVLSLPHGLQTWLPLHALLNDEAPGSKLWYTERKPKLTVEGGIKKKPLPLSPSSQMSSLPWPGRAGARDEEMSTHLKVSDRCHGRRHGAARSDGAWCDSGSAVEAGSRTCKVCCMSIPILVMPWLQDGNYKWTEPVGSVQKT